MIGAVHYAAQADAYATYCEKETTLSDGFIEKFKEKRGLSDQQLKGLNTLKTVRKTETFDALQELEKDCKDTEFMLARLELMKSLKDVSYQLNGVDPETLPEPDLPSLEELLPPPRDGQLPQGL